MVVLIEKLAFFNKQLWGIYCILKFSERGRGGGEQKENIGKKGVKKTSKQKGSIASYKHGDFVGNYTSF